MRVLAFLLAMAILLLLSLAVKAEIDFRYKRIEGEDHIEIDLRALKGLWHFQYRIPSVNLAWEQGPQVEMEQVAEAAGGKRQARQIIKPRYIRRGWLLRVWPHVPGLLLEIKRLKRQFYQGIHCKKIDWRIEIGYADAAQTGLAAGAFWAMMGSAVSRLYRQVVVEAGNPSLLVVPRFKNPGFFCSIQCVFHLRIGHIIFVSYKVLRRIRRGVTAAQTKDESNNTSSD